MNNLCKGCSLKNSIYITGLCFFELYEHRDECPCIQCLVKPICRIGCENRVNLRNRLIKSLRSNELGLRFLTSSGFVF